MKHRCDHCDLTFHTGPNDGNEGCDCNLHGCGCRIKREAAK